MNEERRFSRYKVLIEVTEKSLDNANRGQHPHRANSPPYGVKREVTAESHEEALRIVTLEAHATLAQADYEAKEWRSRKADDT